MAETLAETMRVHMADPFPGSVVKGLDYGEVDAVMIGADIYGWALRADSLSELKRSRLLQAADELQRSIGAFPPDAQPYDVRLVRIARLAIAVWGAFSFTSSNYLVSGAVGSLNLVDTKLGHVLGTDARTEPLRAGHSRIG